MTRASAGFLLCGWTAFAQTATPPVTFDVASVKKSSEGSRREAVETSPGSLILRSVRFAAAIKWAYGVQEYQISGPSWINEERYDISAKAADAAPENQLRTMLQALLAERFKLAIHRQTKEMSAFVVVIGKGGPKMQPSKTEGPTSIKPNGVMGAVAERADLDEMAALLARPLQAPVINMTGLRGRYDFKVDLTPYITDEMMKGKGPPDIIGIAAVALQEQLGLKLESKKVPIEIIVVDRAEKAPTEN